MKTILLPLRSMISISALAARPVNDVSGQVDNGSADITSDARAVGDDLVTAPYYGATITLNFTAVASPCFIKLVA